MGNCSEFLDSRFEEFRMFQIYRHPCGKFSANLCRKSVQSKRRGSGCLCKVAPVILHGVVELYIHRVKSLWSSYTDIFPQRVVKRTCSVRHTRNRPGGSGGGGSSKSHDGKGANGSKNRPHHKYPARCRVPGYYEPCIERVNLRNAGNLQ